MPSLLPRLEKVPRQLLAKRNRARLTVFLWPLDAPPLDELVRAMTPADCYRMLAAELKAKAIKEPTTSMASEWDQLARH